MSFITLTLYCVDKLKLGDNCNVLEFSQHQLKI